MSIVKMPGAVAVTVTCTPALLTPNRVERTVSVTRPGGISFGSCASINVGDVLINGSVTSLAVTQIPPKLRGNGEEPDCASNARFKPRIEMSEPGDIDRLPLALFTTPVAANNG